MPTGKAFRERGAVQRERVLAAATELFANQGYNGTAISAIAKRVGLNNSGVLRHFGTKEGLLRAAMERSDRSHAEAMAECTAISLDQFLDRYATGDSLMEPEELTRLAAVLPTENLNPGDPLHDVLERRDERARAFIANEIRIRQRRAEYRRDRDPDVKAVEIVAFLIGLEILWSAIAPKLTRRAL